MITMLIRHVHDNATRQSYAGATDFDGVAGQEYPPERIIELAKNMDRLYKYIGVVLLVLLGKVSPIAAQDSLVYEIGIYGIDHSYFVCLDFLPCIIRVICYILCMNEIIKVSRRTWDSFKLGDSSSE